MSNAHKTHSRIIQLLKTKGSMTAKLLSSELNITTMGIRQHMLQLEDSGDISYQDIKAKRGRPTRYWSLTDQSNSHFPNAHEDLTLQLIDSVQQVFGDSGMEQLIAHREQQSYRLYSNHLNQFQSCEDKLNALAELRSQEGYMASVKNKDGHLWLLENHCSICAAASQCLNFCRSELSLFQKLFEKIATITRDEHIMQGARRCTYKVELFNKP